MWACRLIPPKIFSDLMAKMPRKKESRPNAARTRFRRSTLPEGEEEIITPGTRGAVHPEDAEFAQSSAETRGRAKAESAAESAVSASSTRELRPPTAPVESSHDGEGEGPEPVRYERQTNQSPDRMPSP